jgi:C4-dicarboxylate-specific signal transduction histidine kinase
VTEYQSVGQDITERKLAEAQVHKHQDELARLSRLSTMGEMATGLAHELNQPLASIVNYTKGCVKRIQAGRPDLQELVAVLNDASGEAQRAGEIIKRIRRFVQKREPARTTIDIPELIRQVLHLMRHDLQRQGIQTRLEVQEHMPTLQGDRIQLQQVLLNLLRNSVEAMNGTEMKHRRLTVGATTDNGDSVTLFVCDTGCGLGELDPDSIFEPFYTTKEDGMGMGLAISRTIVEAHGGRVSATDNADGGCTFHFSLPRRSEA